MIKHISFSNFKCLNNKRFDLGKVNIFSGYNGRGKSSVMQFLLMLSQSVRSTGHNIDKLHLNGEWISLGDFDEILTDDKLTNVGCYIETDESQCNTIDISYELGSEDIKVGLINKCFINEIDYFDTMGSLGESVIKPSKRQLSKVIPAALLNILSDIHFVSANRVGPVKFVEKQEVPESHRVGVNGDLTINTISTFKGMIPIEMNLHNDDLQMHALKDMVSLWMSYIMDGGNVYIDGDTNTIGKSSSILALEFSSPQHDSQRYFKSYNVGFGYSYILSIVVTALIAKKDSIVIIENPEAHLHPQAQSRMALLLSKLADKGVQVFVETHSEHILNGFRLAALKDETKVSTEDLAIYFFDNNYCIEKLSLEHNGRIHNWPKGFFDQAQFDLAEIMKLGAQKK